MNIVEINKFGEFWYKLVDGKKGHLHRDNRKPAIITCEGYKYYYIDGKAGSPLKISPDGTEYYMKIDDVDYTGPYPRTINDRYHRLDGPACDDRYYYIEGTHYLKRNFIKKILEMAPENIMKMIDNGYLEM